ncbi:MAG: TldD/PmbA family protein [Thermodesulfobacteriales bacterium]|nr:MAG: TldD/PmbA family protein [Thermodesulfobacteriales bacterium]
MILKLMKIRTLYIPALLLILFISSFTVSIAQESKRSDLVVLQAMQDELNRSQQELKLESYESPYFISYQIKDNEFYSIKGKYGAIASSDNNRVRRLYVDVRVGDYDFDNSIKGISGGRVPFHDAYEVPVDNDPDAIRATLWQVTDYAYKEALTQYFNKKANNVQEIKDINSKSFTKEASHTYFGPEIELAFNAPEWEDKIRDISSVYKNYKELTNADIVITAQQETVYFVNTEGTKYIRDELLYSIDAQVVARAEDGKEITNYRNLYYVSPEDIPSVEEIKSVVKEMIEETLEMRNAEVLSPVSVPALLEPEAAGVVFHEAVGHRLEGERQIDDDEGQTFKEKVGQKVIPAFLSIIDDPSKKSLNGTHLMGYYPFDDQGVPGERVVLIENGVLKNFLLSRTPVNGVERSNGHGRASYGRAPIARMSNTIIESKTEYTQEKLKELLIEEVKRQNKPFGLLIKSMKGGETNTSSYNFQAYRATPVVIYKVDPKTGKETPVRDIEIVGTPLVSINKIIATGNDYSVFNGFCGAESGYIPVSTVAPSILVSEIEFQRKSSKKEKLPLLPPPFFQRNN